MYFYGEKPSVSPFLNVPIFIPEIKIAENKLFLKNGY